MNRYILWDKYDAKYWADAASIHMLSQAKLARLGFWNIAFWNKALHVFMLELLKCNHFFLWNIFPWNKAILELLLLLVDNVVE